MHDIARIEVAALRHPVSRYTVTKPLAETAVTLVRNPALNYGVIFPFGFAEFENGAIDNSTIVIADIGEIIGHKLKSDFVAMDRKLILSHQRSLTSFSSR